MPRRKLLVPPEPLTAPEQGSLAETIMLGDKASIHATPASQVNWYKERAQIQIAAGAIDKAKAETAVAVRAKTDTEAQLKTTNDEIIRLTEKLAHIESAHKSQLESAQRRLDEATKQAAALNGKIKELTPDAARWTALQSPDASGLGVLAQREAKQREIAEVRKELKLYDIELAQPSGQWRRNFLTGDTLKEYLAKEAQLRRRLTELTESEEEKKIRVAREAKEQREQQKSAKMNYPKLGDLLERDHSFDRADEQPRYTRDVVFKEPKPKTPNRIYGFEKIPDGYVPNSYGGDADKW